MIDEVLRDTETVLFEGGINYTVFLKLYRVPSGLGVSTQQYISKALGEKALLGGASPVELNELICEVADSLRYRGDSSAGPDPKSLDSARFSGLLRKIERHLLEKGSVARRIERFWLKDGHPAYPVFWHFAFLIEGEAGTEIFIGCSSD